MMVEIVSRAEAGLMTVFGLQEISATIAEAGDEAMKARVLPRFTRGEVTGAMVLTEPDAGSDLGAVQTRATYDEAAGEWRLRGVKRFITNGNADVLLVLARSEDGSTDARGLSLFVVEADESAVVRRLENKMGLHGLADLRDRVPRHAGPAAGQAALWADPPRHGHDERRPAGGGGTGAGHRRGRLSRGRWLRPAAGAVRQGGRPSCRPCTVCC